MEKPLMITRHSPPTSMDTAPKGTLCKVSEGFDTYYLQINLDEELPNWIKLEANSEEEALKELI